MATVLAPPRVDRAFERLYRRHVTDVYRYVLAVLQNEADAEDATQTTFLSAYRAFERGDRPERPHNWLIAIAHNVCRQRFRESARRPRCVELVDDVADRQVDEGATSAEDIRRALGFLAFNQRAALVMREVQGRSYGEIASILGVSNAAVETLLFRARRAMREQLEGALSCGDAELALSKRVDGELSFGERGQLRAHLRECAECAALERRLRFRSRAVKKAGLVPLPESLGSFLGGGAAATGGATGAALGAKAAAIVVAGVVGTSLAGHAIEDTLAARDDRTVAASAPRSAPSADSVGAAVVSPRVRFAGPTQAIFKSRGGAARRSSAAASTRLSPRAGARTGGRPSAGAPTRPAPEAALADGSPGSPGSEATPAARERPASTPRGRSEASEAVPARQPPAEPGNVTERRKVVDLPSVPELPKAPELPKPPDLPKPPELPAPEVPKLPDVSRVADAPKLPDVPKPPEPPKLPEVPKPPDVPTPPQVQALPQVPAPPQVASPPELPKLP